MPMLLPYRIHALLRSNLSYATLPRPRKLPHQLGSLRAALLERLRELLLPVSLPRLQGFRRGTRQPCPSFFDALAMFADAICVGNKRAAGAAETSALGRTFRGSEVPVLADSVEKLDSADRTCRQREFALA
jgi:hypothetical protein